mmetsp:Transcript_886/g.920  ORF Transcript_886/g.920 Transcript_886/m.920 type:complete len:89 (+) Transcript_886:46-312(+)
MQKFYTFINTSFRRPELDCRKDYKEAFLELGVFGRYRLCSPSSGLGFWKKVSPLRSFEFKVGSAYDIGCLTRRFGNEEATDEDDTCCN